MSGFSGPPLGHILGTPTNDAAASGEIGELLTQTLAPGSAVALTTSVVANIISMSVPAGDWDIWGVVIYIFAGGTTATLLLTSVNSVSASNQSLQSGIAIEQAFASFHPTGDYSLPSGNWSIKLAGTTTIYLTGNAAFATAGCSAYGSLYARRRR